MSTTPEIHFLWTDLETSGLDEKRDRILEIGWAITDIDFNVIREPQDHVIAQEDWLDFFHHWANEVPPVVQQMHADNGLFEEIQQEGVSNLDRAYLALESDLLSLPENVEVHLAGRSVHFDRGFLLNNDFTSLFSENRQGGPLISHRVFDVRSIRTFLSLANLEVISKPPTVEHRALSDVMGDIHYARSAAALLKTAFPHPPVMVTMEDYEALR